MLLAIEGLPGKIGEVPLQFETRFPMFFQKMNAETGAKRHLPLKNLPALMNQPGMKIQLTVAAPGVAAVKLEGLIGKCPHREFKFRTAAMGSKFTV